MFLAAVVADERTHVFEYAQNANLEALKRLESLDRDVQAYPLGLGHDHNTRQWNALREGQGRVTGSRGQVHQQVVKFAPITLGEQLANPGSHHRSAPDHRLARVVKQEAQRHHFHAVCNRGLKHLVPRRHRLYRRLPTHAKQTGDRWSVDIRVKQANTCASHCQGHRKVRGHS